MKSILAIAALAASAEAILGVEINADLTKDGAHIGVIIQIPAGLELPEGVFPTEAPSDDRTNVYHPPHHGVDMDGCDDDADEEWHWVHPGTPVYPEQPPHVWTTSTVTEVHTSTIIDCDDDVPYCPGKATHYTTVEVPATTVICPVPGPTKTPDEHHETYAPPPVHTTKTKTSKSKSKSKTKYHTSSETLPIPMETPTWTKPAHSEATTTPCPTTVVPSAPYSAPPAPPSATPEHPCYGPSCPPPYAPPAKQYTTLRPQVPSGTVSIPYPPPPKATPTGPVVTAGAAQNAQRVGVALAAGLLVAFF
ncbi:hypothetical protein HJFPF1_05041 [Paramyrothecium foliicola]|nr:hypothetical protein HJFPF1_05041 [Paramyrothecium foliicola]